jgi:hypothetical protein
MRMGETPQDQAAKEYPNSMLANTVAETIAATGKHWPDRSGMKPWQVDQESGMI